MEAAPPPLVGILETVVYCDSSNEDEVRRFYSEVLGLPRAGGNFSFRVGEAQVLLVFNVDETSRQDDPPAHGARGPGHTCFVTDTDAYARWKEHLAARGVDVTREIVWRPGLTSLYFEDPAGNVLEIASGDLWR